MSKIFPITTNTYIECFENKKCHFSIASESTSFNHQFIFTTNSINQAYICTSQIQHIQNPFIYTIFKYLMTTGNLTHERWTCAIIFSIPKPCINTIFLFTVIKWKVCIMIAAIAWVLTIGQTEMYYLHSISLNV